MSKPMTESFIKNVLRALDEYWDKDQDQIPECTKEQLWVTDPVYKYFKNPNASRSTKNFSTYYEAHERLTKDGSVGIIKEVKGEVKACRYCAAASICNQAKQYISEGRLFI